MLRKRLKGVLKTYMYLREVEFITQNFDNVPAHTSFYNQISIFLAQLHITFILNQWNQKMVYVARTRTAKFQLL